MESWGTSESVMANTLLYPQPMPGVLVSLTQNPHAVYTMLLCATIPHAVYSNFIEDVQQQQCIFEILWNKATPVGQRIRKIDHGVDSERIEIVEDPVEIQKLGFSLYKQH